MLALMGVADSGLCHKDHGQHAKNDRLDHADEKLQQEEGGLCKHRHQAADDKKHHRAGEDIAKQTKGEREDFHKFRHHFDDANPKIDHTEHGHLEQGAGVPKFLEVTRALCTQAHYLNVDHRKQSDRHGKVQVCGGHTDEGDNAAGAFTVAGGQGHYFSAYGFSLQERTFGAFLNVMSIEYADAIH